MALKTSDANWFRPLWKRVSVTVFLALWLGYELLWSKDQFWAFLVGAALLYSLYNFFYAFPKEEKTNVQPTELAPPPEGDDGPRP